MLMSDSHNTTLAICGGGPIGLEAALAAAEVGLPFRLFESSPQIADGVRSWGFVRLFSPWSLNVSERARDALEDAGVEVPQGEECPTGEELIERLLQPLAELEQVAPHLELGTRVVSVGREGLLKPEAIQDPRRAGAPFRLLVEDARGQEHLWHAESVFDCTGSLARPNWLGDGGIPAPGERAVEERVVRRLPDLERSASEWAQQRVLLVGGGHSAQTAAVAFDRLGGRSNRDTPQLVWAFRGDRITTLADDPLPERARLHHEAQRLLDGASPHIEPLSGKVVERIEPEGDELRVSLRALGSGERRQRPLDRTVDRTVDRIWALVGSRGDRELYSELQVQECYATGGPMALAASLLGESGGDCLAPAAGGAETLRTPEPGFFLLGSKSYGRNSAFLMRTGFQQVSDAMSLLAAPVAG